MKIRIDKRIWPAIAAWFVLAAMLPLVAVFLLSLLVAAVVAAALLAAFLLVRPNRRPAIPRRKRPDAQEIELDQRDYRRIPTDEHGR